MNAICPACSKEFPAPIVERHPPFVGKLSIRCPHCQREIRPVGERDMLRWLYLACILTIMTHWYVFAYPPARELARLIDLAVVAPVACAMAVQAYRRRKARPVYRLAVDS